MSSHNYTIRIYVMGEVVQELHPETYKEAQQDYFRKANMTTCYTELIVDGERYNTVKAEKHLDPTGSYRKIQRNNNYDFIGDFYNTYK